MKDQDKNKKSELTDTSKSNKNDISNSLERDVTDTPLKEGQTPQARTDNEQDRETKKK
ncbi:hypothetical protein [Pontibacter akesuensis]|uniref:Uncharacterized protein n=1 Tax=Pontibacter akesuensis TaxID=388950 RepID=A0A1I7JJ63_9BACT|nr:hypothetical protein [Pontibacter akesuensis]GHA69589.1 hypothetical protein GCM10007389_23390 [Pontibacter akesuensis]SFU85206.1 hypothetical protein SAMN04487941_2935 [Pontibacter akesuensis]